MVVNVDPHTTSYDETRSVMKFSAVANGVMTLKNNVPVPATPAPPAHARRSTIVRMRINEDDEEEEEYEVEEDELGDEDGEPEDEFVAALLDELSAMRGALYEAQAQTILAVAAAKQQLIAEYEEKLHQLEDAHQQRRREDQDEMDARFDAKLDIIRRVEEARAPLTPGSGYDDSDDEDEDDELDEEEEEDVEEEEETANEASFARSEDEVKGMLSPTPASRLAKIKLEDTEDELKGEEGDDEPDEADESKASLDPSAAGDSSIISLSGDDSADGSIVEHSFESGGGYDDETSSDSRRTTASSTRTPRASVADDDEEEEEGGEDEADEDDGFSISKPAARSPETAKAAKKPKRKLGGKVTDAEAIEAAVDGY